MAILPPALPRRRRKPNLSILHYITGNPDITGAADYPENLHEHYKVIYGEALDSIGNTIKVRFDEPKFSCLLNQSSCFWKRWARRMSQMS